MKCHNIRLVSANTGSVDLFLSPFRPVALNGVAGAGAVAGAAALIAVKSVCLGYLCCKNNYQITCRRNKRKTHKHFSMHVHAHDEHSCIGHFVHLH